MCRFKSGIILKNKCIIAPGGNDSHNTLLESLGIEDTRTNAERVFVRAELVPKNDEWWINPKDDPDKWRFWVDQDILPDWFDHEKYEQMFREYVCDWWTAHVLVDRKIDELSSGYYRLKRCEIKKLCNDVVVILDSSQVGEMWDSSTARDFKAYPKVRIMVARSNYGNFKMVAFTEGTTGGQTND